MPDLPELLDVLFPSEDAPADVRDSVVASWQRSYSHDVHPERLEVPHDPNVDVGGLLHDAAAPILDGLEAQLANEPVSIILTDEHGRVLDRRAGNRYLNQTLDMVELVPGASYSEAHVGTNGIGSTLTSGQPFRVFGTEHYAEWLRDLSCVGAPIRNPATRRVLGVLDLTCYAEQGDAVLCALAQEAASEIERRLRELTSDGEQALFRAFRDACTHTRDPMLGMADDVLMANQAAMRILSPGDQQTLHAVASHLPRRSEEVKRTVDLSGGPAVVQVTSVSHGSKAAGVLVRVEDAERRDVVTRVSTSDLPSSLAGRSVAWRRAWQELRARQRDRRWVLLTGESGVGKSALVRAAHRQRPSSGRLHVIDLAAATSTVEAEGAVQTALADPAGTSDDTLLLRHLDGLDPSATERVARLLEEHRTDDDRPWLVVTMAPDESPRPHLDPVVTLLGDPVAVTPLNHRVEDLHELVPSLLRRVAGGEYQVTRDVMQVLLHQRWPGNVDELERVLAAAAARSWTRTITVKDLPPECHVSSSRTLTAMEAIERDAIVNGLIQTSGNVTEAAERLGISRATVYRRIRTFGIDCDRYRGGEHLQARASQSGTTSVGTPHLR